MENFTPPNNIQPQFPQTPVPPQVPISPVPQPPAPPVMQSIPHPPMPPSPISSVGGKGKYSISTIMLSVMSALLLIGFIFLSVKVGNLTTQLESQNVTSKVSELEKKSISLGEEVEKIKEVQAPFLKYFDEVKGYNEVKYNKVEKSEPYYEISYKSNDEQRVANLNTASTAIGAYYSDREQYPEMNEDGCFGNLVQFTDTKNGRLYFPKGYPKDPQIDHMNDGCNKPGEYAYKSIKDTSGNNITYAMSATMEDSKNGNSAKPLSEYTDTELSDYPTFTKGSGIYYIITN